MKKISYLIVLLPILFTFINCSDSEEGIKGQLFIDNTKYILAQGVSLDFTDDPVPSESVRRIDMILSTDENYYIDGWWYAGNELAVYFEFYTSQLNHLASGVYTLNNTDNSFSIKNAQFFDYTEGQPKVDNIIVTATVTILNSSDDYYELTFDCVDSEGHIIEGNYSGNLIYLPNLIP